MIRKIQATLAAAALGTAGLAGFGGIAAVQAQPQQDGLVNVALVDTTVQVPIAVAANICDVNVNVLSRQLAVGPTACGAAATATAVDSDNHGNSNVRQNGLVNIYAEDTTVQVPVGVAANLCDVSVNVLAGQLGAGQTTCNAIANTGVQG